MILIHAALVHWNPGEQPKDSHLRAIRFDLLDSALNVIKHDEYYKGLHHKAAALFRSIIKNHAFVDGNKRTAVLSVDVFLGINGFSLEAEQDELVKFSLRVAKGYITDLHAIRSWLKRRTRKCPEGELENINTTWRKIKAIFLPKYRTYIATNQTMFSVDEKTDR